MQSEDKMARMPPGSHLPLLRWSLANVVPEIKKRLERMALSELEGVLGVIQGASRPPPGSGLDGIVTAILQLPMSGSKLDDVERAVVLHAVETCDGNISAAARLVGIDRKAMERRYRKARRG